MRRSYGSWRAISGTRRPASARSATRSACCTERSGVALDGREGIDAELGDLAIDPVPAARAGKGAGLGIRLSGCRTRLAKSVGRRGEAFRVRAVHENEAGRHAGTLPPVSATRL